jgi:hypothetical protein
MTEQQDDPNAERERLAREAMGRDPGGDDDPPEGGPWAKTSSGDADSITDDDD